MLNMMNRRVETILGDGNCMFRCLALIAYGDEMLHAKIRELLVDFISENRKDFYPYIDGNIVEYITRVRHARVWGTAVELIAAASLFGMPVFTLTPHGDSYRWLCYQPLKSNSLVYPKEPPPVRLQHMDHIELFNVHGCHYDCILSRSEGVNTLDRPPLSTTFDLVVLD